MKFNVTQAIIGVAGCIAVGVAIYITQNSDCLWGLLFVGTMISNVSENSSDN